MSSAELGGTVRLVEGDYVVVAVAGGNVRLRDCVTGEYSVVHITELTARLLEPAHADEVAAGDLDALDENELHQNAWLAAHLRELQDGTPRVKGAPVRPEYDPARTSKTSRLESKSLELEAEGHGFSVPTLKRKLARLNKFGEAGLVDRRSTRVLAPLSRADGRIIDALRIVINNETKKSTGTQERLVERLRMELSRSHPNETIALPSNTTIWSYVKELSRGKYTMGNAKNRRTASNSPRRMFDSRPAILPGSECQIDSSPFDIMVLGPLGTPVRVVLTILLDKATHSILATSVLLKATRGVDHALMLARSVVPRPARPHSDHFLDLELPSLPWARVLTPEESLRFSTTRPFIMPRRIMTDNGSDFLGAEFRSACQQFGISLTEASVRTPTDKAMIERAFHTIKTKFAQYLPGFSGGSVDRRGDHPESDELLDVDTLRELFDRWVEAVWQNMPMDALRDPLQPSIRLSPNAMHAAMFDLTGFLPYPRDANDYIRLMPSEQRSIQSDGIVISYRRYDSPELDEFRMRRSSNAKKDGSWTVKYDPYDLTAVWIQHPVKRTWIECQWMNKDAFKKPYSATVRKEARRMARELGLIDDSVAMARLEALAEGAQNRAKQAVQDAARNEAAKNENKYGGFSNPKKVRPIRPKEVSTAENATDLDFDKLHPFDPNVEVR
jgi:transposase InsO family protein